MNEPKKLQIKKQRSDLLDVYLNPVRVNSEKKKKFLERCEQNGDNYADVIRSFMEEYSK